MCLKFSILGPRTEFSSFEDINFVKYKGILKMAPTIFSIPHPLLTLCRSSHWKVLSVSSAFESGKACDCFDQSSIQEVKLCDFWCCAIKCDVASVLFPGIFTLGALSHHVKNVTTYILHAMRKPRHMERPSVDFRLAGLIF